MGIGSVYSISEICSFFSYTLGILYLPSYSASVTDGSAILGIELFG